MQTDREALLLLAVYFLVLEVQGVLENFFLLHFVVQQT